MKWFGENREEQTDDGSMPSGFDDFDVRLGDLMRGERATLGKSLLDVQRELHIRATYIAAIEAGDLSAFEATSFVAGYVRSYARYLGMDPDWCYAQFCAETSFSVNPGLSTASSKTPIATPVAAKEFSQGLLARTSLAARPDPFWRRLDPGALGSVAVLLALIVGLGFGGWTVLQEVQRVNLVPVDQPPEVMTDIDPVIAGAAPRLDSSETGGLRNQASQGPNDTQMAHGVVRTYRPESLDTPVMVSRDGPISGINPRLGTNEASDASIQSALEMAMTAGEDDALGSVRVTQDGPPQVEVLAVRASWIRVRAADGSILFENILDAGERYTVPQSETPATLRAGNSGSVYMLVNGQAFGPTAPGAQVVDQIALSPEAVADRFDLADLSRDRDLEALINFADASQ